jgi:hypothetical protein
MKRSWIAGCILAALVTSCSHPEKPLAIPDLREVSSVKVSHIEGQGQLLRWEREIRDPKRIDELLVHFRTHNSGYRSDTRLGEMLFGPSGHEYKFDFKGEGELSPMLMVWIGPGRLGESWIGGEHYRRGETPIFRYRRLSASELSDLLAIVLKEKS